MTIEAKYNIGDMAQNELIFTIKGKELERVEAFKKKHRESCVKNRNLTIGEYWSYTFVPGGLGTGVIIECNLCGEYEDVTDDSSW
jgi:hypothetical protein